MGGMLNSGALTFTHSYMVMFLSTECGLSAGESALVAAGAIYLNAILAPILGFVADNFYSTAIGRKFGRRRFWILLAIPMMIAEPLIFTVTPLRLPVLLRALHHLQRRLHVRDREPGPVDDRDDR